MLTTFKDFEDAPHPLVQYGLIAFFAVIAAVAFSRMAAHETYAPAILGSRQTAPVRSAHAARPAPAYLRIRPKLRPWYGNTEGDWAARLGECLHLPAKTVDNLRYEYRPGITSPADFTRMYPYVMVSVSPEGACRRLGSGVIRDRPKTGMVDVNNIRFVGLARLRDGSHVFAYRTE